MWHDVGDEKVLMPIEVMNWSFSWH